MKAIAAACAFALTGIGMSTLAADYDGSKLLICANVEAADCEPGQTCARLRPEDVGAPAFLRIDFANSVIVGPHRTTPIALMEKNDQQLLLQGTELGYAWSLVLDARTGKISATLADRSGVVVLFGACMPIS